MGFVLSGAAGEAFKGGLCGNGNEASALTHVVAEVALVALYFQVTTSN